VVGEDDGNKVTVLGPFGDKFRHISRQPDGSIVAGCFHGSFEEFKAAVVEKYGPDYGGYANCVKMLEALV